MSHPAAPTGTPGLDSRMVSRRRFLGFAATALAGIGGIAVIGASGSAHDGHDHGDGAGTPKATPGGTPAGTPVAEDLGYTISSFDLRYEPKELRIPAGVDITLIFINEGVMPHDLVIPSLNVNSGRLAGGDSVGIQVNAPKGSHMFYCSVAGHKQAGMVGALIAE